jgi:transposase
MGIVNIPFWEVIDMLCNHSTEKLLGLKGVIVKNVRQLPQRIEIVVELPRKPHICPCCGHQTSCVHDYRWQTVKDIPAFGKHTVLILRKRRYRCPFCGKRFFEDNPFLPRYYRMTSRLAAYVISNLTDVRSFTSVAREVNLSVSTVIRVFDCINYGKPAQLPEVVSIDEFKGNTGQEKYQCILTDPVSHRILDILPTRSSHYLTHYFHQLDRSKTTHFISDMWSTYAHIAQTYFKNAVYVIDKYHYIRQVFWAFEALRKEEQKKFGRERRIYFKHSRKLLNKRYEFLSPEHKQQVDIMLFSSSHLLTAYSLKEQFLKILDCKDSTSARTALSHWIMTAQNSGLSKFVGCGNTMVHWSKGILNSFDCSYTNGFTEGANNKIKVLKRNAYGYRNFRRFRNRILHMFNHSTQKGAA